MVFLLCPGSGWPQSSHFAASLESHGSTPWPLPGGCSRDMELPLRNPKPRLLQSAGALIIDLAGRLELLHENRKRNPLLCCPQIMKAIKGELQHLELELVAIWQLVEDLRIRVTWFHQLAKITNGLLHFAPAAVPGSSSRTASCRVCCII